MAGNHCDLPPVHRYARSVRHRLQERGSFLAGSVAAFWLVIMTYVGVNFVLGIGLHSYGFGTGAVVRYMFLLGGIDLAFVAACAAVYLLRRPSDPATAPAA